jgi:hypothetical protein
MAGRMTWEVTDWFIEPELRNQFCECDAHTKSLLLCEDIAILFTRSSAIDSRAKHASISATNPSRLSLDRRTRTGASFWGTLCIS